LENQIFSFRLSKCVVFVYVDYYSFRLVRTYWWLRWLSGAY